MLLVWKANGDWADSIHVGTVSKVLSRESRLPSSDGRGRLVELRSVSFEGHALLLRQVADYFPSSATFLALDNHGSLETIKHVEHAGHIHAIEVVPGFKSGQTVIWTAGMTRNSGPVRAAARGIEGNTFFVCCIDANSPRTQVFPVFDPSASGEGDLTKPAPPRLYFVYRGFRLNGEDIDWTETDSVTIANAWGADDRSRSGVLLSNNLRLEADWSSPDTIRIELSLSGRFLQVLEKRNATLGHGDVDPVQRFLADSVVCLAYAPPGVTVIGPFRDIRPNLPEWIRE